MGPALLGFRRDNGGVGVTRQAQHLAQGPEGVHIGLMGVSCSHAVQQTAYVGKRAKAENGAARQRRSRPDRSFLIQARGQGNLFCRGQGSYLQGPLSAHIGNAVGGQLFGYTKKFKGLQRAGMDHATASKKNDRGARAQARESAYPTVRKTAERA